MLGSGRLGRTLGWGALFALFAFIGCGGSSKSRGESGDDRAGSSGTSNSGGSGNSSGGVGAAGASGASSGGTTLEPRGGSGAVDPIDPPGPVFCGGEPCDAPLACCRANGTCFDPATDSDACPRPAPDDNPQGQKTCASNLHCEAGEFCDPQVGSCEGIGHCVERGNCGFCESSDGACRVCGCDGNTYPDFQTACRAGVGTVSARAAGCGEPAMEGGAGSSSIGPRTFVPCAHDGNCQAGSFCCTNVGRCYTDSDRDICIPAPPGTRIACKTTENCGDGEYCSGEGCDGPGGCVRFGSQEECGVTLEPVCGCDGTTYTSAACAATRGVRVDYAGECDGGGGE